MIETYQRQNRKEYSTYFYVYDRQAAWANGEASTAGLALFEQMHLFGDDPRVGSKLWMENVLLRQKGFVGWTEEMLGFR